ncbi:chromosomal replication initiator protein DnaA [Candidatus Dependentiae bacterium]
MLQGIWEDFLKIAKEEAGSRVVDTWFKAVSLYEWDSLNKVVYLRAPNTFVKDWISSNYAPLVTLHLGRLLSVENLKVVLMDGGKKNGSPSYTGGMDSKSGSSDLNGIENKGLKEASSTTLVPAKLDRTKTSLVKKTTYKKRCHINASFHFDNFVAGPSNSLAKAAAQAITDKPGTLYNPLFIYGDSGLGKTHLLHAVGNSIKKKNKNMSILYQTADRFVNEFINAIRFDKIHKFQTKYQNIDVLLIDDIQFISNKEQTQEAFFHIFNVLYDSHKQIVFSSDTFPNNISGLAERLRSRLGCGLVTDIHTPSLETKVAILKKKAKLNNQELSDEIAYFVASLVDSNIRELEGALIRVTAFASLTNQPLSIELAKKVLSRSQENKKKTVDFDDVAQSVCKYYRFSLSDLKSKKRKRDLSFARQVAMFLMKKLTCKSLREIGAFLGGRDHSTVLHAIEKIEKKLQENKIFKITLENIERATKGG